MILPSPPSLIDDELPPDAPPAYDDLPPQADAPAVKNEKSESVLSPATPSTSTFLATSPVSAVSSKSPTSPSKGAEGIWAWIPFPARTRAAAEVRVTVLGLIRELVKRGDTGPPARPILSSCDDVCRAYRLSLSSILQDRCVEGHSALYWAVIKRPKGVELSTDSPTDVLGAFLTFGAPLSPISLSEIRLACLQKADQALFQQLRQSPSFAPLSGKDDMLLSPSCARDEIYVEDIASEDAFAVRFRIPMFQQRLRVSKHISLEFIARGRLWSFRFLIASADNYKLRPIAEPGSWVVTLSLLEHSAPTAIDSRLVIQDVSTHSSEATSSSQPGQSPLRSARVPERRPPIEVRLKSAEDLAPDSHESLIAASFKKNSFADRLQYDGSPYIGSDGSLDATLEARLGKPGLECVIC